MLPSNGDDGGNGDGAYGNRLGIAAVLPDAKPSGIFVGVGVCGKA